MNTFFFLGIIILLIANFLILLFILLRGNVKKSSGESEKLLNLILTEQASLKGNLETLIKNEKDEFERNRTEYAKLNREGRVEQGDTFRKFEETVSGRLETLTRTTNETMLGTLTKFQGTLSTRFEGLSNSVAENLKGLRDSMQQNLYRIQSTNDKKLADVRTTLETKLQLTTDALSKVQKVISDGLREIQGSNEKKLEEMRVTVDEKLQSTLEKRLSTSFKLVTTHLEAVQKGLGEMQNLASDVGGLKRALTTVKQAGSIGEVKLETLLQEFLSPEQYEKNAHPNPQNKTRVVEFAVKFPDKSSKKGFVYFPIDAKYPATIWENLSLAYEKGDKERISDYRKKLVSELRKMARDIHDKYIEPPFTTDFAMLFLPSEGIYSEVVRIPGLMIALQKESKVIVCGPTVFNGFLNSLQMGFRSLAVTKDASKIRDLLVRVRNEFGKFEGMLAKTREKLENATKEIGRAETQSHRLSETLERVSELPSVDSDSDSKNLIDSETGTFVIGESPSLPTFPN